MLMLKRVVWLTSAIVLAGCSSVSETTSKMFPEMLETAPRSEHDVMHPEWADAPIMSTAKVGGPNGQYRSHSWDELETYLVNQGLDYELIPGDYVMIRLKQKIHFNTGSANVADGSAMWLEQLANFLSRQQGVDVVIGGHTDNTGTVRLNDSLSDKRAESVKRTLIGKNVPRQMIYTRGYGEYVPACTNTTQFGKACNRRVELTLIVAQ
ncbi:OmpA family protein [Vibrio maritimus]|uniref:Protein F-related protein n=1 Tax=Vibrio maritimus TaxID=990268 RepID=A0A090RRT5_9VIBR|nr:OmpA family protein [Vibrio sp. SCSIO 43140]USD63713.1 OmpA family protein [Vibrio sp. SCSIO 43140]GAL18130.1 protein F-related protein [Vibrio maritimus]